MTNEKSGFMQSLAKWKINYKVYQFFPCSTIFIAKFIYF